MLLTVYYIPTGENNVYYTYMYTKLTIKIKVS